MAWVKTRALKEHSSCKFTTNQVVTKSVLQPHLILFLCHLVASSLCYSPSRPHTFLCWTKLLSGFFSKPVKLYLEVHWELWPSSDK